jgi:hypothetical protein
MGTGTNVDACAKSRHKERDIFAKEKNLDASKQPWAKIKHTTSCPIFYRCHVKHAKKKKIPSAMAPDDTGTTQNNKTLQNKVHSQEG